MKKSVLSQVIHMFVCNTIITERIFAILLLTRGNNDANTNCDGNGNDYACRTANNLILSCYEYTSKYCTNTSGTCYAWHGYDTKYLCIVNLNNLILKCEAA